MKKHTVTKTDTFFDILVNGSLIFFLLLVAYPLYYILISSFSDPIMVNTGQVTLWPKGLALDGYRMIINDNRIWLGYKNTIIYSAGYGMLSVCLSLSTGYALSKDNLVGRRLISFIFIFTMYFGGGLIPTYLVVKQLGLINKPYTMFILGSVSVFHIILARTYFQSSIPADIYDSAKIDGCNEALCLVRIVLPLCKPLIAVLLLYCIVQQWNSYFAAMIYLNESRLYPLQLILRSILIENQSIANSIEADIESIGKREQIAELIKYGVIVISSAPLLILYPFLQRYFVQGIMIGAVKG